MISGSNSKFSLNVKIQLEGESNAIEMPSKWRDRSLATNALDEIESFYSREQANQSGVPIRWGFWSGGWTSFLVLDAVGSLGDVIAGRQRLAPGGSRRAGQFPGHAVGALVERPERCQQSNRISFQEQNHSKSRQFRVVDRSLSLRTGFGLGFGLGFELGLVRFWGRFRVRLG